MSFYSVTTMNWQSKKFPGHPGAGVVTCLAPLQGWVKLPALHCPAPDPNRSLAEKRQQRAAAEPSPTQTSASIQGWTSWHQVPGKAGERTVPSCWERACSRGRWGISIKEGNNQLYKCSAVQKRLPYWLQDYCSSFWPPPKPDVTAQGTILYSSVFLWTLIYSSSSFFFVVVGWLVGFAFAFFRVFCWVFLVGFCLFILFLLVVVLVVFFLT